APLPNRAPRPGVRVPRHPFRPPLRVFWRHPYYDRALRRQYGSAQSHHGRSSLAPASLRGERSRRILAASTGRRLTVTLWGCHMNTEIESGQGARPLLFQPYTIRGVTIKNRTVL